MNNGNDPFRSFSDLGEAAGELLDRANSFWRSTERSSVVMRNSLIRAHLELVKGVQEVLEAELTQGKEFLERESKREQERREGGGRRRMPPVRAATETGADSPVQARAGLSDREPT